MVVQDCVKCEMDNKLVRECSPLLIWFGEEKNQKPCERGAVGTLVSCEDSRHVVQLKGPAAARNARLVLFHSKSNSNNEYPIHSNVLVWAWARYARYGKFLEGSAMVKVKEVDDSIEAAKSKCEDLSLNITRVL